MSHIQKRMTLFFRWIVNFLYAGCLLFVAYLVLQLFFFCSFRIPSDSMNPSLIAGDQVLVAKLIPGPRLFDLKASFQNKQVRIYRAPGIRKIRRNDVLVFNFPHPHSWDTIQMHILKYYIKRCVALPGDTFRIANGSYQVAGLDKLLGNVSGQHRLSVFPDTLFQPGVWWTFPYNKAMGWTIKNFGPLYIPRQGDSIPMNQWNTILYKKVIEWETGCRLQYEDGNCRLDGKVLGGYRFTKNYYFVAGDRVADSQDSRYWGLLPEEYIVGKAWLVWRSEDPHTNRFRWKRFMHVIR